MKRICSAIIPLARSDIDTDLIIPAKFLTTTSRAGLGEHLFSELRRLEADFPLNQKQYQDCQILVTRENFGCGSSREHAAWALRDWGIQVVIAPSFADIFYNNAMKNQILPAILRPDFVEQILNAASISSDYRLEVDLASQSVHLPTGEQAYFEIDPYRKECLLNDLDDLDYLLMNLPVIEAYDRAHSDRRFCHPEKLRTMED
jgi:3-isopropylmalate/(R)-2-methylmalate dehydratase small subunit